MIHQVYFLLITTILAPFFLLFMFNKNKTKRNRCNAANLPPGPRKLPLIGNLHQLGKLPHRSLHSLSKKYGDLMSLQLGSTAALVVSSAQKAQEIFKNHDVAFSGRPPLYAAGKVTYNHCSISMAPYGEYWREMRKIAVLELLTVKRVESYGSVRLEEVSLMIDEIAASCSNPVDLSALAFSLSNKVICRVAFGMKNTTGDLENLGKFQKIVMELNHQMVEFNVADYFPWLCWTNKFNGAGKRIEENMMEIDRFFDRVIGEHREQTRHKLQDEEDIIDVLLRVQEDPDQPIRLKEEHLKGVLVDIFVAGTETSSTTIVWTMTELMRNPQARHKAQQQVRQIGEEKGTIDEKDLPKLTYLNQVIKESMRLHPPAPLLVPRETTMKCTIGEKYEIPEKTRAVINVAAISRDPGYWERPEEFWPERFADSLIDYKGQHFELLPFGAGRRGCPGINFAVSLVELALANLLFWFDWELPSGMSMEDFDMEEAMGITVSKKTPLCLVATKKNKLHCQINKPLKLYKPLFYAAFLKL